MLVTMKGSDIANIIGTVAIVCTALYMKGRSDGKQEADEEFKKLQKTAEDLKKK